MFPALILALSVDVWWHLTMVLMFIFLMSNGGERIYSVLISHYYIYFYVENKGPFQTFIHFLNLLFFEL